jgi:hypothetical protein
MKGSYFRILPVVCFCFVLAACGSSRQIKSVVRSDLFSIGYGLSENQIDLSSGGGGRVDIVMREGIFHILDGTGKKIMKLSSYGDLLALLYDPTRLPEPRIVKPMEETLILPPAGMPSAQGRYAASIPMVAPGKIAVDTEQTVYIVDRVPNPSARIFDAQSATFSDRIVRRFGARGMEMPYIGQEGPGGSPFPFIMVLDVLENDTLAVVSASESIILVHHFGKAGNLLSSLRLNREALPLPGELEGVDEAGMRIHANLDGILESSLGDAFGITLKLDYYREYFNPESLVISRNEFAGSWLIILDGSTGRQTGSLAIAPGNQDNPIPELVGTSGGLYYFLSGTYPNDADRKVNTASNPLSSRVLQLVDGQGKVHIRYRIDLPEGTEEIIALKVSAAGQVYGLLKTAEAVKVAWWNYR